MHITVGQLLSAKPARVSDASKLVALYLWTHTGGRFIFLTTWTDSAARYLSGLQHTCAYTRLQRRAAPKKILGLLAGVDAVVSQLGRGGGRPCVSLRSVENRFVRGLV